MQVASTISDMAYLLSISAQPLGAAYTYWFREFWYQSFHLQLEETAVYLSLPYFRAMAISLFSVIIWKEFGHPDILQKIMPAHYTAASILTGYGKHRLASTLEAFVIHKHAKG